MTRLIYWLISIIAVVTSLLVFVLPVMPGIGDLSPIVGEGDLLVTIGMIIHLIATLLLVGLAIKSVRLHLLGADAWKYDYLSVMVLGAYVIGVSSYILLMFSSRL